MSRYLILVLLNLPLIVAGIISSVIGYKLKTIRRSQLFARLLLWGFIFVGLISVKNVYDFLFSSNLTRTEPLSLFDVVQITGIVFAIFLAIRARTKADLLQRQVHELHQQLVLHLSSPPNLSPKSKKNRLP